MSELRSMPVMNAASPIELPSRPVGSEPAFAVAA
jgi:hypothetical protein